MSNSNPSAENYVAAGLEQAQGGHLEEDYVVLLDDLHSIPLASHPGDQKLFTLSMAGFYLFIFKLSVHFCRLHEHVDRRSEVM